MKKLFSEFPPVPTERWEEVITADLKGADYDKKLVWRTREGFDVRPYYRAEDLAGLKYLGAAPGQFPYVRGVGAGNKWLVAQSVSTRDEALKAIAGGAEHIIFRVANGVDVAALLDGISVAVTLCGGGYDMVREALAVRKDVGFCLDPLGKLTRGEALCGGCFDKIAGLVKDAPGVGFVMVGGHDFGNAGSTIVQELAFMLAMGHEYLVKLMEAGLTAEQAAGALRFKTSVSANYFMEIAKFRAARMLWATICKEYGVDAAMCVHAESSRWNMTVYDPYVNMLRGTTEAMSAAIGGVCSMEVLPFDAAYADATEFGQRIARNVQLLLKHEAHFDNVADPAGGSYYIEMLTQNVAGQAWALFKQVEERGGYASAVDFIGEAVEASAAAKAKDVATRKIVLLGSNQYPNFGEVSRVPLDAVGSTRGAVEFERMRLRVDHSGRNPKVFLLTCGTLGMARARAQFATNFFGCAGFRIEDNTFFKSVAEGVRAAVESKAAIVVICAADDDYAALAPEAYKLLGGEAIFVVAGAPASQAELEAQGIRNFISVRSNVLATLEGYVKELGL